MTSLDLIAKAARQLADGVMTVEEFVGKLTDYFAGDPDLDTTDAVRVAGLVPVEARGLLLRRFDVISSSTYQRPVFALGGRRRTQEEEHAAALRETARERAWAMVLRPLLTDSTTHG